MLLLNKGWKRRLLEVVEAIYKKNTCYLRTEEHREIGCEFRENTGNLILTRTRPPCFTSKNLKVRKWKKNKNNMTSGSGGGQGAMAPLALLKLVKKDGHHAWSQVSVQVMCPPPWQISRSASEYIGLKYGEIYDKSIFCKCMKQRRIRATNDQMFGYFHNFGLQRFGKKV